MPRAGGLPTALLILALLICHGVLGFAHQAPACGSCGPAGGPAIAGIAGMHHGPQADAQADAGGAGGPQKDDAPSRPGHTGYFAAMVALFGVALLGLLFVAPRRRGAALLRSILRPPRPPAFAPFPRAPSPPFLQAFRL